MKKLLCTVLIFALLFSSVAALCESDDDSSVIYIDTTFLDAMDSTASEWYENSYTRAAFSILALADLSRELDDLNASGMLINTSYVGRTEYGIMFCGYTDGVMYTIHYSPMLNSGAYWTTELDLSSDALVKTLMKTIISNACGNDYSENDLSSILEVVEALSDSLNN